MAESEGATRIDRRKALQVMGVGAAAAWVAPSVIQVGSAAFAGSASPCGLPGGDPCTSQTACGSSGPFGCSSAQSADGKSCVCGEVADCSTVTACAVNADCGPGQFCVQTCCGTVCVDPCGTHPAGPRTKSRAGRRLTAHV